MANTPIEDRGFLPARAVWERYGVSEMTLHRWINSETMKFPKPSYFGRYRYFKISDLETWERSKERASATNAMEAA
jgi:predicted DNA-binding transcriptional regulator AlpA